MDRNQPAVELLLAHKADVNARLQDGWTPLHAAASKGIKAIAELLLKAGADVNAKTGTARPRSTRSQNAPPELAELLLANKADPNAKDKNG